MAYAYESDHHPPLVDTADPPAISSFNHAFELKIPLVTAKRAASISTLRSIPRTSLSRQRATFNDCAFGEDPLAVVESNSSQNETVLYLAYGSNLSAETFLGKRGIKPLSQVNVVAPQIALSFDLPGIPYSEPCFGNCRYREIKSEEGYHKNAWKKGLVGVVYEVTRKDYAHIIATEGGGSGYQDVLIDCYALEDDATKKVPESPEGDPFRVHTLYSHGRTALRPDPDYAQPSPRYLKLITDGAYEHDLPHEYRHFLENIRTYHVTTNMQRLGSFVFLAVWAPLFMFFFGGARIFLDKDGRYPKWYAKFAQGLFTAVWASYDGFFQKTFGDGERTIGDELKHPGNNMASTVDTGNTSEKTPLLASEESRHRGREEV